MLLGLGLPAMAWEPTAPVELVVPAGTGGGADLMARFIQQAVSLNYRQWPCVRFRAQSLQIAPFLLKVWTIQIFLRTL